LISADGSMRFADHGALPDGFDWPDKQRTDRNRDGSSG
jgi:hypothetical protein